MRIALEEMLRAKAAKELGKRRPVRSPVTERIFMRRWQINPDELVITNYPRRRPVAAFNPGTLFDGEKIYIFPRLIFDYHSYASSVGLIEIGVKELLMGEVEKPLETRIILWPQHRWEITQGCEDARAFNSNDEVLLLYTAVGRPKERADEDLSALALAVFTKDFRLKKKGIFMYTSSNGEVIIPNKDSAFICIHGEAATLLTRPTVPGLPDMCWRAWADLKQLLIPGESLWPVLFPEPWELKMGWSTNAVPLSEEEFLVGWHAVLEEDLSYRNGLALVNQEGELLAVSNYLLSPSGVEEEYGDRPKVIFGNGLFVYEGHLVWIGGISDYSIGIFIADLKRVLERLKPLQ